MRKNYHVVGKYAFGVLAFSLYYVVANLLFGVICPSLIFFGLPCPGCGLTRAGFYLITGDFAESFRMHPLLIPGVSYIVAYLVIKKVKPNKINRLQIPAIILLAAMIILYVIRMVSLFPHTPPMVMHGESILHNIIFILRERT